MRILVSGPKDFDDYQLLRRKLNGFTLALAEVVIVTGVNFEQYGYNGHRGVDFLVTRWCDSWKYPYMVSHERKLGERHREMVSLAQGAVIFSDGEDRETLALLALCRHARLKIKEVRW